MRRAVLAIAVVVAVLVAILLLARFTSPGKPESPLRTVHHFRDWHFVDRDLFGKDVGLDGEKLDIAWNAHLDAVEEVQAQQLPLLRELVDRGVTTIYLEGLTPEGIKAWYALAEVVRFQIDNESVTRQLRDDALATAARSTGQDKTEALKAAESAQGTITTPGRSE